MSTVCRPPGSQAQAQLQLRQAKVSAPLGPTRPHSCGPSRSQLRARSHGSKCRQWLALHSVTQKGPLMGAQTLHVSPLATARDAPGRVGQVSLGEGSALSRAERPAVEAGGQRGPCPRAVLCVAHSEGRCWLCPTQRSPRWPVGQAVGKLVSAPRRPSVSPGLRRDSLKVRGAWCEMESGELASPLLTLLGCSRLRGVFEAYGPGTLCRLPSSCLTSK